jgi:uncharacterized protein YjiS (DUF1127 family)
MSRSSVLETPLAISCENTGRHMMSRWAQIVKIWLARWHGRRELRSLDDEQLKDVGISCGDVLWEAGKPFWRP